jgi:hypothetical protein
VLGAAGTSKEKTKLKAKLRGDEKEVDAAVQHYLKLVPFGALPRPATLTTRAVACTAPSFPWTGELAAGSSSECVKKWHLANNERHLHHDKPTDLVILSQIATLQVMRALRSCGAMECLHPFSCAKLSTR